MLGKNRTYIEVEWIQGNKVVEKQPIVSLTVYAYLEDTDVIASSARTNNTGYVKIEGLLPWNDYKMCCTPVPLRGTGIYCHKKDPPTKTLPGGELIFI